MSTLLDVMNPLFRQRGGHQWREFYFGVPPGAMIRSDDPFGSAAELACAKRCIIETPDASDLAHCWCCSARFRIPWLRLIPRKALTQYSTSVWTQQQGLPQDAVRAIAQTTDGYLWLGTDEGLARFDGYEFVSFNRERGAPASNSISALAAGRDGSLWIGSRSGLTRYKDGRFQTYTRKDGLIDNLVSDLFVDHAGILWIVAGGNLSRFDGTRFTNFARERDIPCASVRAVTESPDHRLYICGNSSVVKFVDGSFVTVIGPSVLSAGFSFAHPGRQGRKSLDHGRARRGRTAARRHA